MTSPYVLAVPRLYKSVKDLFAAEAAQRSVLATSKFTGTAAPSLSGVPTAAGDIVVRFPTGGTVGTPGILYEVSTDGGDTYAAPAALDVGLSITVLGVVLTLVALGTVIDADRVSWTQTAPSPTAHVFGWSEPSHRSGGLRVVWVPGDDEANGAMGELGPASKNTEEPRSLATLHELATVYLEARDATDKSELAQYAAGRFLYDAFIRAVQLNAYGTFAVVSQRWDRPTLVSASGATIRLLLAIDAKVPDEVPMFAPATAHADETAFNSPTSTDPDQADVTQRIDPV